LTTTHVVSSDALNQPANGPAPGIYNPMLTDFTYDNLGIPVNHRIAELAGLQQTDLGLGAQDVQLEMACETCDPAEEQGKFRVSTLRNLARTAPYGHNGFFATIYDIVHFYNTRDVEDWPVPEVFATVNKDELGNLGLTLAQEQKLVLFLETLDD
jgi:cytochrome c peroxidase